MTPSELADEFKLASSTVRNRLKSAGVAPVSRGSNGRCYPAKAARTACRAVHHKRRSPAKTPEEKDLQERKLLRECEKLEFELAVKRREYLPKEETLEFLGRAMAELRDRLLKIPAELSDRLDPPLKAELGKVIRLQLNDFAARMHEIADGQ